MNSFLFCSKQFTEYANESMGSSSSDFFFFFTFLKFANILISIGVPQAPLSASTVLNVDEKVGRLFIQIMESISGQSRSKTVK